jgi:tRNA pseudouridine38-40 synthase
MRDRPTVAGRLEDAGRVVRLLIAYDGSDFRGWARQRDRQVRTVEGAITDRLEEILREPVRLSVAGRTDAGVHAAGQVASFHTSRGLAASRIQGALNATLAPEVVVRAAVDGPASFDARHWASARVYRYEIDEAPVADPFTARFVWHRPGRLSLERMRAASRPLIGEHDFMSFCRRPGPGVSTVRRLERVTMRRDGHLVTLGFRANAFLHQMVRSLVGTLVAVGEGRIEPESVTAILAARSRSAAKHLAPPRGLVLDRVVYRASDRDRSRPLR